LGERLDRTQEVAGSSPASSIAYFGSVERRSAALAVSRDCGLAIQETAPSPIAIPKTSARSAPASRLPLGLVTAKEQLLERVRGLSEAEAAEALRLLDARQDPLSRRLDDAPLEDEEISPEEEAAVQEARDELASGAALISHEEIKREFGSG
jgi:hypothetical protein